LFCSSSLEPLNRWFFPLLSDILIANGDLSKNETNVFLYIQMATTWMKAGEMKISWFYFWWRNDEKAGSILAPNFVFQTKSELSLRRVSYLKMNKNIFIFIIVLTFNDYSISVIYIVNWLICYPLSEFIEIMTLLKIWNQHLEFTFPQKTMFISNLDQLVYRKMFFYVLDESSYSRINLTSKELLLNSYKMKFGKIRRFLVKECIAT
jgi:hypothetical protein